MHKWQLSRGFPWVGIAGSHFPREIPQVRVAGSRFARGISQVRIAGIAVLAKDVEEIRIF